MRHCPLCLPFLVVALMSASLLSACAPADDAPMAAAPAPAVQVQVRAEAQAAPAEENAVVASMPVADTVDALRRAIEAAQPAQSAACLAHTRATEKRAPLAVHRWIDKAGITHYSDQAPPANAREQRVVAMVAAPGVVVQASGYDVDLPNQLQQRAVADALGVQRLMHDTLGVPVPVGMTLKIVFVRSEQAYARLVGEPSLAKSSGAYSTADRTIHVRMQEPEEINFAVLRHEITHALVHESIGNLPVSLNEGMAEYFGRYRTEGMGGQIDVGAQRAGLIGAAPGGDGSEALVDLLSREGADFYAENTAAGERERRYLRAYALIALLMRDRAGQSALEGVLTAQALSPCVPVAAEKVLDAGYSGGLSGLAREWTAFMHDPPRDIRSY
jgi:hypothetical protein